MATMYYVGNSDSGARTGRQWWVYGASKFLDKVSLGVHMSHDYRPCSDKQL